LRDKKLNDAAASLASCWALIAGSLVGFAGLG